MDKVSGKLTVYFEEPFWVVNFNNSKVVVLGKWNKEKGV